MSNALGLYLRDRRGRLDPVALGFPATRRRTPGLRREEVAARAHVSATWYTWLEQGRGGAPSADVLDRIARAMLLTEVEREHIYLLGLGRAPEVTFRTVEGITPRLQRVLDALESSPAMLRNAMWDVVAWNRAAAVVLGDYGAMAVADRNILRLLFCNPAIRARQVNWEHDARFVVASFRAEAVRAGASAQVAALVSEMTQASAEFARIWAENDVRGSYGEITKQVRHPVAGLIGLEPSSFAVEGRPDLALVIYNPSGDADRDKVRGLLEL
ncbi:MAG: transcriptional regulator [Cypionkella sp.]|uniref:helix-turn-helix transcriptional regulator n=1 Tax=Cypionkella sp. TaxID=2811411 RepID=UPI002621B5C9|nr:helix-turn-helix transcriptional regulator [Cypionkella sp.]MDB5658910.1 transcriptional regulator [Cypionkella sp.]